jgi:precorrin-3B C17-methyltransferase
LQAYAKQQRFWHRVGETSGAQAGDEKRDRGRGAHALYVVGIGPGGENYLSQRARQVINQVEAVAGYTTYLDLIRPLISGKKIIVSGMKKEVERVREAIQTALSGTSCALVSSGDPGIYALAGLVFELCRENNISLKDGNKEDGRNLYVEVVPGIPALCAGAALLGAPLVHDFAAISLSDLLTPWEIIEKRLSAAADADFVIVLYNPRSKKRNWQLDKTKEILLGYRSPETPVGIVTGAMRENQRVCLTTLENLNSSRVDMQTTLFIGNSKTFVYEHRMVTPRGYGDKYDFEMQVIK